MQIDLKQPQALDLEAVRAMIGSGNPAQHNQLRVSRDGIAYLSTEAVGGMDINGLCFRLETWAAGSGCVGAAAAADDAWVGQIFRALRDNWPAPKSDYIDMY
jgi:hypothetical protein